MYLRSLTVGRNVYRRQLRSFRGLRVGLQHYPAVYQRTSRYASTIADNDALVRRVTPSFDHEYIDRRTLGLYSQQILTALPQSTSLTELIGKIRSIPADEELRRNHKLLLFVTPSYAPHLRSSPKSDTSNHPVRNIIRRVFEQYAANHKWKGPSNVDVVIAVVDRLTPLQVNSIKAKDNSSEESVENDVPQPLEGISCTLLPVQSPQPAWDSLPHRPHHSSSVTVRFALSDPSPLHWAFHDVELPLSNTIFQTGTTSTMFAGSLTVSKGDFKFHELNRKDHVIIFWPKVAGTGHLPSFSAPLLPLTSPRRIEEAVGNIISRVKDSDDQSAPASADLERMVDAYFKHTQTPAHQVSVWALVYSEDALRRLPKRLRHMIQTSDTAAPDPYSIEVKQLPNLQGMGANETPPVLPVSIQNLLWAGAELRRVVSGGGGWGKKAGLLALDPTPKLTQETVDSDSAPAFPDIAKAGDYIQHFLLTEPIVTPPMSTASRTWSFSCGAISSLLDDGISELPTEEVTEKTYHTYNHLGISSEKGFRWRHVQLVKKTMANKQLEETEVAISHLDVPNSRYHITPPSSWVTPLAVSGSHVVKYHGPAPRAKRLAEVPTDKFRQSFRKGSEVKSTVRSRLRTDDGKSDQEPSLPPERPAFTIRKHLVRSADMGVYRPPLHQDSHDQRKRDHNPQNDDSDLSLLSEQPAFTIRKRLVKSTFTIRKHLVRSADLEIPKVPVGSDPNVNSRSSDTNRESLPAREEPTIERKETFAPPLPEQPDNSTDEPANEANNEQAEITGHPTRASTHDRETLPGKSPIYLQATSRNVNTNSTVVKLSSPVLRLFVIDANKTTIPINLTLDKNTATGRKRMRAALTADLLEFSRPARRATQRSLLVPSSTDAVFDLPDSVDEFASRHADEQAKIVKLLFKKVEVFLGSSRPRS